jgi:predicted phosphodiesterase
LKNVKEVLSVEKVLEAENKQLRIAVRDYSKKIDSLHDKLLTEDKVKELILGLKHHIPKPPVWTSKPINAGAPGIPMTIWSDFHWGETVASNQINGLNSFNLKVARERLHRLVDKTISLCFDHMVKPQYPGIVLMLGGDMVSGDIHEELEITNETPSGPVLIDLLENLIAGIDKFLGKFGKVWIVGVAGNHGRTNKKPRFKNRQYTNFDWMVYQLLRTHYKGDNRIEFLIPDGADAYFKVYNTRFLLTHGDNLGVNGGDGIIGLIGPVMRGDFKIRNAQSAIGMPYDVMVMGHWHTYLPMPKIIVNGSLKGFDEYAHLKLRAKPERPVQALWFVHPLNGITNHWAVYCDAAERKASGTIFLAA